MIANTKTNDAARDAGQDTTLSGEAGEQTARKVLEVVDAGLVRGVGNPVPGQMCVEAAVNFALGFPHGDEPQCVGRAVRRFKIRLNDASWSSKKARTRGMRKLAIAQLGSNAVNQRRFAEIVELRTVTVLLPEVLRDAARRRGNTKLLEHAAACSKAANLAEARSAAYAASADYAYDSAASFAASAASADYAAGADYAAYAAASAAYAAGAAQATADGRRIRRRATATGDKYLLIAAEIGLQALIDLHCRGTMWLDICA